MSKKQKPTEEANDEEPDFLALMGLEADEEEEGGAEEETPDTEAKEKPAAKGKSWWDGHAESEEEALMILKHGREALEVISDPEQAVKLADALRTRYGKGEAAESGKEEATGDDQVDDLLAGLEEVDLLPTEKALLDQVRKAEKLNKELLGKIEDANKRIERMEAEITGGIPLAEMEHLREATGKIKAEFGDDVAPSTLKELMEKHGTKDPILAFKASKFDEKGESGSREQASAPRDMGTPGTLEYPDDATADEIFQMAAGMTSGL